MPTRSTKSCLTTPYIPIGRQTPMTTSTPPNEPTLQQPTTQDHFDAVPAHIETREQHQNIDDPTSNRDDDDLPDYEDDSPLYNHAPGSWFPNGDNTAPTSHVRPVTPPPTSPIRRRVWEAAMGQRQEILDTRQERLEVRQNGFEDGLMSLEDRQDLISERMDVDAARVRRIERELGELRETIRRLTRTRGGRGCSGGNGLHPPGCRGYFGPSCLVLDHGDCIPQSGYAGAETPSSISSTGSKRSREDEYEESSEEGEESSVEEESNEDEESDTGKQPPKKKRKTTNEPKKDPKKGGEKPKPKPNKKPPPKKAKKTGSTPANTSSSSNKTPDAELDRSKTSRYNLRNIKPKKQ